LVEALFGGEAFLPGAFLGVGDALVWGSTAVVFLRVVAFLLGDEEVTFFLVCDAAAFGLVFFFVVISCGYLILGPWILVSMDRPQAAGRSPRRAIRRFRMGRRTPVKKQFLWTIPASYAIDRNHF
jgi:hypothetical protein